MKLKKVLNILLVLCMTAGFLTGILPGSALAAGSTTTIVVGVGVADVKNAGTDSSIYLRVGFVSGGTADYKLDTAKHDDFERKSYKEYTIKVDKPAWEINKLGLNNSGSDAMCIGYVNYQVSYGNRGTVVKLSDGSSGSPLNIWLEKSNHMKAFDLERDANPYVWVKVGNTSYDTKLQLKHLTIQSRNVTLWIVSGVREQMDSQRRSTTFSSVEKISFRNPIQRSSRQICSIGFISGVYGGI